MGWALVDINGDGLDELLLPKALAQTPNDYAKWKFHQDFELGYGKRTNKL